MEPAAPVRPGLVKFGIFELDESAGELRRNGSLVHLPPQLFQVLALLARNAGEVVDRNRIRREVWGDTAVDFDRSLNVAIAQIRSALNDNAESPRFIQTLPRRGYRFLAAVDRGVEAPRAAAVRSGRSKVLLAAAGVVLAGLAAGVFQLQRAPHGPVRIAVLPFEALSLDAAAEEQSDELFDELLTRLGRVQPERLQVIGRRSVEHWKARGAPGLREAGDQLKVQYAIEASARRERGELRVAVRLVQTSNEAVLWSATFTQDSSPRLFEEALVSRVSAAVLGTLFPGTAPRPAQTACEQGWDAYQTGRLLANRGGTRDLERSVEYFQQASCAAASGAQAEALVRLARTAPDRAELWERSRAGAQAALRNDPGVAAAHLALGNIAFWRDWNWQAAQREFGEALRINPSDPGAHHDLAWVQVALGLRADALASLETAIAIDPLSARTRMDSAWLLLQIGRFDRAAAEARRTMELDPEMTEARGCLSRALLYAGDLCGAMEASVLSSTTRAAVAGMPPDKAVRRVMELALREGARQDPYHRAWRLAWLGSRAEALGALEDAFRGRSFMMPLAAVDPAFTSLRGEPRFRKIVKDLGLGS